MKINITVDHSDNFNGAQAVCPTYNMDVGPLVIPDHIRIGKPTWDKRDTIHCYDEQVDEYDIWLEDQIKVQNITVMEELDIIFNKALSSGVILTTRCCPQPYRTHAHVVANLIKKLSG